MAADGIRVLLIGDPHVTVEELPDCQRLLDYVDRVAVETNPKIICFLGDQHHNHAVVRVEVLEFWARWIRERKSWVTPVWMLVGNHDRSHDAAVTGNTLRYENENDKLTVVAIPKHYGPLTFLPWYANPEDFRAAASGRKVLICHQTIQGARYENGYPAQDGVPEADVPAHTIISGHIHTPQEFGKTWYVGAPRWRIASDANVDRFLWLVDFDPVTGQIVTRTPYKTSGVCSKIWALEDTEGPNDTMVADLVQTHPLDRVTVSVRGSPTYVETQCAFWRGKGYKALPFPTRERRHEVRESDGVGVALRKHVESYRPKFGTPPEVLQKLVAERVRL